jgi:hypothetical protein
MAPTQSADMRPRPFRRGPAVAESTEASVVGDSGTSTHNAQTVEVDLRGRQVLFGEITPVKCRWEKPLSSNVFCSPKSGTPTNASVPLRPLGPRGRWGCYIRNPNLSPQRRHFGRRLQPRVRAMQLWYQDRGGTGVRGVQFPQNVESEWSPTSIGVAPESKWRPHPTPVSL